MPEKPVDEFNDVANNLNTMENSIFSSHKLYAKTNLWTY